MKRYVKITEARFIEGKPATPDDEEALRSLTNHTVFVGNDEEGWRVIPGVMSVDVPLRQGEMRKATITVAMPQIEFEGKAH